MNIAVKLEAQDFIRMAYFAMWKRLWPVQFLIVLCLPLWPFAIWQTTTGKLPDDPRWRILFYLGILFLSAISLASPYFIGRRNYLHHPSNRQPLSYRFTPAGIHLDADGSTTVVAWRLVHDVWETKTLFLIFHTPQIAWVLPKRCLHAEEKQEWRDLVLQYLPERSKFRSGGVAARLF